jgi:hypothetical protein
MILRDEIQILQGYLQWLQNCDKQIFSAWFVEKDFATKMPSTS